MNKTEHHYLDLLDRLQSRRATIGVIGLGYVGLPICLAAAKAGYSVLGLDTDPAKPERLAAGESYLKHIPSDAIASALATGRFNSTCDMSRAREADALLICVPTPLTAHLEPDLSYVTSTAETIARFLRKGQLVTLESTTYPGTTDELVKPILESSGLDL